MPVLRLYDIHPGETCRILDICHSRSEMYRLMELGFLPGASVRCEILAPSGSPIVFWVNGALIALRRSDCAQIGVLVCE